MTARCFRRLVTPGLAFAAALSSVAAAQSVDVSHDRSADFHALKTYAMGTVTVTGDPDPRIVQRVVAAVDRRMTSLGFRKVETNPDVVVATQHWRGVSYPYWWSHHFPESDIRRIMAGRVVVVMTDPHSGRVLFRGTAEDRASRRAERNERKADEAVAEIFEKSPWGREPDE